jgi:hypothetical protein
MHLTLKNETTRPAGMNSLQQQTKFDDFLEEFNNQRTHQALDMKFPVEVYTPSLHPPTIGYSCQLLSTTGHNRVTDAKNPRQISSNSW